MRKPSRFGTVCGVLALAVLLGLPARAGDAEQHTLTFAPVKYEVGDVVTYDGRIGFEVQFDPERGKRDERATRYEEQGWIAALKIEGFDRSGHIEKALAWFESAFVRPAGETEADMSVNGARGTIDRGRWTNGGGHSTPSGVGRTWIEDEFAKKHLPRAGMEWANALAPKEKVAAGATWTPDLEKLAAVLSKVWDCEFVADGATGTCKLESTFTIKKSPASSVEAELSFPVRKAAPDRNGRRADLPKDARFDLRITARMAHEGRIPWRSLQLEGKYRGPAKVRGNGELSMRMWAWWGVKHDGWIPDPAK